jgi:TM2 domain-containing membrane protein YozV
MSASVPTTSTPPRPHTRPHERPLDPLAAVLSYILPGLGQILQGRIAKGLLFFFSIYTLFFYGMAMGAMKNVWLPPQSVLAKLPDNVNGVNLSGMPKALGYRTQFLGQFWIGAAAWPAVVQYFADEPAGLPIIGKFMAMPPDDDLQKLQRDGNKRWDLGWVYTLIAGVLNLLVIYDALAGPVVHEDEDEAKDKDKSAPPDPNASPQAASGGVV